MKQAKDVILFTASDKRHVRKTCGIPEGFWSVLDEIEARPAVLDVRKWLSGSSKVALFAGEKGNGKSIAMAHAIDEKGGLYLEAFDAVSRGLYDDWDDLILEPLMALDEMEMAPQDEKGWAESKLYKLLSGRFQAGRRTMLGTNLGADEFKAKFGSGPMERLWDRMTSSWDVFTYSGPSMRGQL